MYELFFLVIFNLGTYNVEAKVYDSPTDICEEISYRIEHKIVSVFLVEGSRESKIEKFTPIKITCQHVDASYEKQEMK